MHKDFIALFLSGIWISLSEFIRNEVLFKSYWINKYQSLGLEFPSLPVNNVLWGLWSFLLAGIIVFLSKRLRFFELVVCLWIVVFVMMWIVIGNLNVLPLKILIFAVPLSLLEILIATFICKKITYSNVKN